MFTINTEAGELTFIPHLLIPEITMSSWLEVRVNIV